MARMSQKETFYLVEYTQIAVFLQADLYPIYFLKMDAQIKQRIAWILKKQIDW